MGKIVMEQEELEEILDNYDYKKSLFISQLRKLNEGNIKNIEDLKVLTSKFTDFNSNFKSLKDIETEIKKISQFSKNIDVSEFQAKLKSIVNNAAYKLELENNELEIQSQHLNNQVQNIKEIIPKVEDRIIDLLSKSKQKLEKEINITSKFLRVNTLFATFLSGGLLFGGLIYYYHLSYIKKTNDDIVFLLLNNDREFIINQLKKSTFFAGYNDRDELIIKIHNDKKED